MVEKKVVKKDIKTDNKKVIKKIVKTNVKADIKKPTSVNTKKVANKENKVDDYYASVKTSDKNPSDKRSFKVKPKRVFKKVVKKEDSSFAKTPTKTSMSDSSEKKAINPVVAKINAAAAANASKMKVVSRSENT